MYKPVRTARHIGMIKFTELKFTFGHLTPNDVTCTCATISLLQNKSGRYGELPDGRYTAAHRDRDARAALSLRATSC